MKIYLAIQRPSSDREIVRGAHSLHCLNVDLDQPVDLEALNRFIVPNATIWFLQRFDETN
jgi:hypothetical protein